MDHLPNQRNLLAFVTTAREGSVSRAAEVLNLTQPAISHQLRKLASETGLTLFTRGPHGVHLTPDGAALLVKARQVIDALDEFRTSAGRQRRQISGSLRIGTIVDPEFTRLGQMLGLLRAHHPEVQTELVHGVSGDSIERLDRGRIDAGFYLSAREDLSALARRETPLHAVALADFTYRVIGPAGWEGRIARADWESLAAMPWIGTPPGSVHNRLLARALGKAGTQQNIVALVDQEASMLEMVRAGVGLSLCRDSIALHQRQSHGLALCEAVTVPACLSLIAPAARLQAPTTAALFALLPRIWPTADAVPTGSASELPS
ncbi:LysR family transcriptional regulator [Arenibacterium halophilum]|uniref:LysR family transcriptional regulator n=1 Tax=Arenibacterium halophilum TaxID=2583821 RepID=A0ABY2X8K3_9RHOB|nr:LysR family transcriptional regulator [Arenibacterium halophilum]TMV12681.1 LysR family transcriptional regulator [Arenibacterium halophilum]